MHTSAHFVCFVEVNVRIGRSGVSCLCLFNLASYNFEIDGNREEGHDFASMYSLYDLGVWYTNDENEI